MASVKNAVVSTNNNLYMLPTDHYDKYLLYNDALNHKLTS